MNSERGAVLIQVAIALLGLTAFSALVFDYGVLWTSRGQAQNAADSGALSAAISLMNNPIDPAAARSAARATAGRNPVWGESPAPGDVLVQTGLPCPPGSGGGPGCVRVDVMRGARDRDGVLHTNTMPTFFAYLLGIRSQAINATATAQVSSGNSVSCIKPWIVADKWIDNDESAGGWSLNDTFNPPTDVYVNPGFNPRDDYGLELPLKPGNIGTWSAGWAMEIDLGATGSSAYRDEIEGCPTWVPPLAIYDGSYKCDAKGDLADPSKGCVGVKTGMSAGPTSGGVHTVIAMDPSAYWTGSTVAGGCMVDSSCVNPAGITISPRIVPVAVFDTASYYAESSACSGTGCVARVTNLIGFFLEGMCDEVYPSAGSRPAFCGSASEAGKTVLGRIINYPGAMLTSGGTTTSSFAQAVRLVR